MTTAFLTAIQLFKEYSGSSIYMFLFLLVLLYLWLSEEKKGTRVVLIYLVVALFALFFFPVFTYIAMEHFLDYEVYYRMMWLLPIGGLVSYGAVLFIDRIKEKKKKAVVILLIFLLIMANGTFVFRKGNFSKAENEYHVPQVVVDILDIIEKDDYKYRVAFPAELLEYPRQVTGNVFMPYGREILIERWENSNTLFDAIQADSLVAETIAWEARQNGCDVLVIDQRKNMDGDLESYSFLKIGEVDQYGIYMEAWLVER